MRKEKKMTTYIYTRVSTDIQDTESQKFGCLNYLKSLGITDYTEIRDAGISGKTTADERSLGKLLNKLKPNDLLIASELSRLGRNTKDLLNTCDRILKAKARCHCVKESLELSDTSPTGKLIITIMAALVQMERELISMRTKEALARKKAMGIKLGRQVGSKNKIRFVDTYGKSIVDMYEKGYSCNMIAEKLKCSVPTIAHAIDELGIAKKRPIICKYTQKETRDNKKDRANKIIAEELKKVREKIEARLMKEKCSGVVNKKSKNLLSIGKNQFYIG